MIGVKSRGRLGNQMFIFAFGFSFAKKHGTEFYVDALRSLRYFNIPKSWLLRNYLLRGMAALRFWRGALGFWVHEDGFNPKIDQTFYNDTIYIGYYQSAAFFWEHRDEIRKLYTVKEKYRWHPPNAAYAALHIRLGDYKNQKNIDRSEDISMSPEYFKKALELLLNFKLPVRVVTDDPEEARKLLGNPENCSFQKGSEIEDFQCLLYANKLAIANSTFSWWAAFLNERADFILAPKYWLGHRKGLCYPKDIFAHLAWTLLD